MKRTILYMIIVLYFSACNRKFDSSIPTVGFLDFIQDETIEQAKTGFFKGLADAGYSEEMGTLNVIYRNAQGDIPTLGQACDYLIAEKPVLIASNVTLSTITAVQKSGSIPIFMMVSPRPDLAGLTDSKGNPPVNLFGTYETLDYIDTSVMMIRMVMPKVRTLATLYNQSEPQSVAALARLSKQCALLGIELNALPVNNSSETQLVTRTLLAKKPDAFFALPDNVIFASFETVAELCNEVHIPIFTSEAGLVSRGALCSFGADFYQWGLQSGRQAAQYLKNGTTQGIKPELVQVRNRVYNPDAATRFGLSFDSEFSPVK